MTSGHGRDRPQAVRSSDPSGHRPGRDPDLFPKLAIPDATLRSWLTRGVAEVVALDQRDSEFIELHAAVAKLEKKVAVLTAAVRLLVTLVRVAGITLGQTRLPVGSREAPNPPGHPTC